MELLYKRDLIEKEMVEAKELFATLRSSEFLQITPLCVNNRETFCNIKLVSASLIIISKGFLSLDDIRAGLTAFTLISRETKSEFLPLFMEKIMKAFRLVNKTICETVLKKWYQANKSYLDCESENRMMVEKVYKQRSMEAPFLLPHEFLYLLCNSTDRLSTITRVHKPDLISEKGNIHYWELLKKKERGH